MFALASDYQSLALSLEVVLDIGLEHVNLNCQPTSTRLHLHSDKCPEVLRFQSRAVLFSLLRGFLEGGPAGSRFPSTPSPAGKDLLQHSHRRSGERVFSHSGLFMRPHRARMGYRMLSDLVLLKCNKHI